ncbi:MAG: hypothetical protein ABW250_01375 [Pyrinomonadaceae bacterium]
MKRVITFTFAILFILALSASAHAQCWSATAGPDSSLTSDVRPSAGKPYEAMLLEFEPTLQKALSVSSKVYMTEATVVRSEPRDGNVYFGRRFFNTLDERYKNKAALELLKGDVVPIGLKLILAHEYAHQFQFRMFKKRNIALTSPTPAVELQADMLASYVLGSLLDAQYSNLPQQEKVQQVLHDSSGAMMVVAELGDEFFNDANHHGDPTSRRTVMTQGFEAGWVNKFGPPATAKEDELYDWSLKVAEQTAKNQHNGRVF